MVESYIATAVRHLVAQRFYTAINIVGLAVALAAAMLVGLFVRHELSYDRYHTNANRVYRVSWLFSPPGAPTIRGVGAPPIFAPLLKADFPEIEQVARLRGCGFNTVLSVGDRAHPENGCVVVDNELLGMLDFVWIAGDRTTALLEPYSIVLTESIARKYFGSRDALGETLTVNNRTSVTVTGVVRDLPDNTHLRFDMMLSMGYLTAVSGNAALESRNDASFHTYVLLRPGADIRVIRDGSTAFIARHLDENLSTLSALEAVPIADIHLAPAFRGDYKLPGSVSAVYASAGIAALIVLVACINFVNLATASARRRAKEVGVRKVVGASRARLIVQFLGESVLVAALAAVLALAIVELLLPVFNGYVERSIQLTYGRDFAVLEALVAVSLLVGLAAGSFPAFYLSAFDAARVLKGDATRGRSAVVLRNVLVGMQFAISIALLIAVLVVYRQVSFVRHVDLGYDTEQIVVVAGGRTGRLGERWEILKREWSAIPGVAAVTASGDPPGAGAGGRDLLRGEGGDADALPVNMHFLTVDFDFFATYGIDVIAGRAFSRDSGPDASDVDLPRFDLASLGVVNEEGARAFGWTPAEAVGKTFQNAPIGDSPPPVRPARQIVGVVENVHYESLRERIPPTMYVLPRASLNQASIKLTGADLAGTLAGIDEVWSRIVPEQPIARRFLDEFFDALYRAEERQGWMLGYCAALAIAIACLGLFGLAALTTEQRTKEIGIRRVMGGTIVDIVRLLARELGVLAMLANLAAWPAAYFLMRRWLDGFAYRIDLGLPVFVGSGLVVLAIAWVTVAAVAARAAAAKPIRALRYE